MSCATICGSERCFMNSALITTHDFVTLVKILQAFLTNERPVDLVVAASNLYEKLEPQATLLVKLR